MMSDSVGMDTGCEAGCPLSCIRVDDFALYQAYPDGATRVEDHSELLDDYFKRRKKKRSPVRLRFA
jgi:hypothetical protein